MEATIEWAGGKTLLDLPGDESGFWHGIADALDEVAMPWKGDDPVLIEIECPLGRCDLVARGRDNAFVDGEERPSPAIFPAPGCEVGIRGLSASSYEERYLTFCSVESSGGHGSYKFYRLFPTADGRIGAEYGRIGQRSGFGAPRKVRDPYPSWMYWVKLKEKLMKGYTDQSDVYLDPRCGESSGKDQTNAVPETADTGTRLYALLMDIAEGKLRDDLVQGTRVTKEQVAASRRIIAYLGRLKTVKAFNRNLLALLQVSPRTADHVASQMAKEPSDFAAILNREQSLLAAMEAVVCDKGPKRAGSSPLPSFSDFGVDVRIASAQERTEVMGRLSRRLRAKVKDVYAVEHAGQSQRFGSWCERRGIEETKMLWHGSPACNWASIVQSSLRVPAASGVAHGAMFGRGIYFSENGYGKASADDGGGEKSWGYTGSYDSRWNRGASSGEVFMALFEVAYGTPLVPSRIQGYSEETLGGAYDCVRAKAGTAGLANDEIIVYSPDAVRIRFLVRFDA